MAVPFLSQEWLDLVVRSWPEAADGDGPSVRLQLVVTGAPGGEARYWCVVDRGRLAESGLGDLDQPEVTITLKHAEAVGIQKGEQDLNAGLMAGRVKVAGSLAKLMSLLPLTASAAFAASEAAVASGTGFEA